MQSILLTNIEEKEIASIQFPGLDLLTDRRADSLPGLSEGNDSRMGDKLSKTRPNSTLRAILRKTNLL
ncbi:hypothetical protein C7T94_07725 [Pedobacter yulinensis]|uniref:Uncharacterized protein n=1 Tax=Pedobacter yulinensis TaxID=2126353 RepID=A0A2T3HJD9_9SPHI|nr:hypothetical protein [Pedobacter yulinensis]PST82552.1 hypothetical protein C7T94_07725 [Pedobacter yulinensis]